jgi:flavin-dependent dehydrogenase
VTSVDVVVVGGGPAGCAAAIGLARAGAMVVLLERSRSVGFKPGEILAATIAYPLAELGLDTAAFTSLRMAGNVSAWGQASPVEHDVVLNPHGAGYLVDRAAMEEWLLEQAAIAGVAVHRGVRRVDPDVATREVTWLADAQMRAQTGMVIDATGRGAGVVGSPMRERVDALVGLLAYVDHPDERSDRRLYIEATECGYWYSAPLPGRRMVLACMTDADFVPAETSRLAYFRASLERTALTRSRVRSSDDIRSVVVCPAMSTQRSNVTADGWVAIGDAASTYDPISGQGVACALTKGIAFARLYSTDRRAAGIQYEAAERAAFDDYLELRRETYARGDRWGRSEFWRRRTGHARRRVP